MGAICVSKQQRDRNEQFRRKQRQRQREQKYALQNCVYAQKVRKFAKVYYGREVTKQTKQFIQNNYNSDYCSQLTTAGYPTYGTLTLTYKSSLVDRFQVAYKNRFYTYNLEFIKLQKQYNRLTYKWQVKTPSKTILYDCTSIFDDQDRFKKTFFRQQARYQPPKMQPYIPQQVKSNNHYQSNTVQNNYYRQTDWNAYYNAEVQRSNDQFRQNMNKQAQEWNNYARQKNSRGW